MFYYGHGLPEKDLVQAAIYFKRAADLPGEAKIREQANHYLQSITENNEVQSESGECK